MAKQPPDPLMQPCRKGCGELVCLENDGFHVCRTSKNQLYFWTRRGMCKTDGHVEGSTYILSSPVETSRDDAVDAAKWRAFRNCARIRVLGSAGFTRVDQYRFVTLEAWTQHDAHSSPEALKMLEEFVAVAQQCSSVEPTEPLIKAGDRVQNEVGHTGVVMTVGDTRACVQYDDGTAREPLLTNLLPMKATPPPCGNPVMINSERYRGCRLPSGHEGECSAQKAGGEPYVNPHPGGFEE